MGTSMRFTSKLFSVLIGLHLCIFSDFVLASNRVKKTSTSCFNALANAKEPVSKINVRQIVNRDHILKRRIEIYEDAIVALDEKLGKAFQRFYPDFDDANGGRKTWDQVYLGNKNKFEQPLDDLIGKKVAVLITFGDGTSKLFIDRLVRSNRYQGDFELAEIKMEWTLRTTVPINFDESMIEGLWVTQSDAAFAEAKKN